MDDKTLKSIRSELKLHARALGIPSGAANDFIEETLKSVQKSLNKKSTVTSADINRLIVKNLKKYHADFAYVYEIHDKII